MIKFFEAIKIALTAVWANKGRAFLTMLGMIIGIASVVSLMAIGEGVKVDVSKQISDMGSNLLFVFPGKIDTQGNSGMSNSNAASMIGGNIITEKDVDTIRSIKGVEKITPLMLVPGLIKAGDKVSNSAMVVGVSPDAKDVITGFKLEFGRFITKDDSDKKVIVLGSAIAKDLFEDSKSAIGKDVVINKNNYQIIGIIKEQESSSILGSNEMSGICCIPLDQAVNQVGTLSIHRIMLKVKDANQINSAKEEIKNRLLENHGGTEDFSVLTQDDVLNFLDTILKMMTALISAIASISLVVGGIGIMNIMLVSVTERTHEIGLRKAVGATGFDILWQFLIEAIVISILGAAIGLGFSWTASAIVSAKSVLHPIITLNAIGLAVGISVGIGIVFGLLPAIRAARKNPIDALRWE